MEPEKTRIDVILDAYDHRLVEARQREAEQESREVEFGRRFAHFRGEVAEPILTSVGLQLAGRGHGSEIGQDDQVYAVDGRQETMPAIAIRLFPGSLHPVPGVERYPSLTILGARRTQKVIVVADARLRLPGDEEEQDQAPKGGEDGKGDDGQQGQGGGKNEGKDQDKGKDQGQSRQDQGKDQKQEEQGQSQNRQDQGQGQGQDQQQRQPQSQQGQKPPQQQKQEPSEETMELFELTPQRLRDRLIQLVADAFGPLPRTGR